MPRDADTTHDTSRDFISAYGVAAIVVVVLVLLIWQFGFVKPSVLTKTGCDFGESLTCTDVRLTSAPDGAAAVLTVTLANSGEKAVDFNFNNARATAGVFGQGDCSVVQATPGLTQLAAGANVQITCSLLGEFPARGEKVRLYVDAAYRTAGNPYWSPLHAEIIQPLA